jgi:hypothetical protein
MDAEETKRVNAQDFVDSLKFPTMCWFVHTQPIGVRITLRDATKLPFDLSGIEGSVSETGIFTDSRGHLLTFTDEGRNANSHILKIGIFEDEEFWREEDSRKTD